MGGREQAGPGPAMNHQERAPCLTRRRYTIATCGTEIDAGQATVVVWGVSHAGGGGGAVVDTSSGGSVDTTKTRSDPQRVRMSSGRRPTGTAKGKHPNTEALCHPPPPPRRVGLDPTLARRRCGPCRGLPLPLPTPAARTSRRTQGSGHVVFRTRAILWRRGLLETPTTGGTSGDGHGRVCPCANVARLFGPSRWLYHRCRVATPSSCRAPLLFLCNLRSATPVAECPDRRRMSASSHVGVSTTAPPLRPTGRGAAARTSPGSSPLRTLAPTVVAARPGNQP